MDSLARGGLLIGGLALLSVIAGRISLWRTALRVRRIRKEIEEIRQIVISSRKEP